MNRRGLMGPALVTGLLCLWLLGQVAAVVFLPGLPGLFRWGAVVPLALTAVSTHNLRERIHEIRSGESDDLDNY